MLLVSLPWYDLREIRSATDVLWNHLARKLKKQGFADVPDSLNRQIRYDVQWTSGSLLFSQACGYDVLMPYQSHLQIVATPVYQAPGCRGPWYSSVIVVREDSAEQHLEELRGARAVINSLTSHSGMNVLRALIAPLHRNGRFFSSVEISSSHEASLRMICEGTADVAAIDCVTYFLLERHRPLALSGTRVLCYSRPMPGPPFVTRSGLSEGELRGIQAALFETLEAPVMRSVKEELLLESAEILPLDVYLPIAEWEREALKLGYIEMLPADPEELTRQGDNSRLVSGRPRCATFSASV